MKINKKITIVCIKKANNNNLNVEMKLSYVI